MKKVNKVHRLFCLLLLVPATTSLVISSVYAGRKKFKTVSFATPLLPSIVKVEPNKFHLTFRQNKYMKTPNFKIEGTIPLKAPTIVRELLKPEMMDPYPQETNINIGDLDAIPEANQHVTYDDTSNQPVFAEPPKPLLTLGATWKPKEPAEIGGVIPIPRNRYPSHHMSRRETQGFFDRFDLSSFKPNFGSHSTRNFNFQTPSQETPPFQYMQNNPSFNYDFYNPRNIPQQSSYSPGQMGSVMQQMQQMSSMSFPSQYPNQQFSGDPQLFQSSSDLTASPSSYGPAKFENVFKPSNPMINNGWVPINTSPSPAIPPVPQPSISSLSNAQKKLNIGEHYNPSASYVSEKMVEKPTYDPDDTDPDEGSISFSISGPHGGEEVPVGYGERVKAMHEELKNHPEHLPPGLDAEQLSKYYSHHTFTDALKPNYGYKPAFGPLGFFKSKMKSWKNILF